MKFHKYSNLENVDTSLLDAGDVVMVRKGSSPYYWEQYKLTSDGELAFVRGVTDEQYNRLEQITQSLIDKLEDSYTKEQIDDIEDALRTLIVSTTAGLPETFPNSGDTLTATDIGQWTILTEGTYNQAGYPSIVVGESKIVFAQFDGTQFSIQREVEMPQSENKILPWTGATPVGEQRLYNGQIWTAVTDTINEDIPGVSSAWVPDLSVVEYNPSLDYLHIFQDANGAVVAYIDINGRFVFNIGEEQREYIVGDVFENISDTQKNDINNVKVIDNPDYMYLLVDAENKVIFSIDKDGLVDARFKNISYGGSNLSNLFTESYPTDLSYEYEITSQEIISSGISLPTIAVGKESSEGANDAPTIPLTDRGLAHPSVVYHPSGWNGWRYWMAFTPYFPPTVGSVYENPHIMVSNDGITWQEPAGIQNPIDKPQALPNNGYWSDTHLKLGDDGMMHVWYRGNYMDFEGVSYTRFVVHRKSRDGVNWSDATLCYSTSDPELAADNQIVSPAFIKEGSYWNVYDVLVKSQTGGISPVGNSTNNQTNKFISRRISFLPEKDYEPYSLNKIINFKNRPWGTDNDTWHLDAQKFGNTTFLLLSVGSAVGSVSDTLWLAYSGDGWNFTVFETPLMANLNYRSCMVFKESTDDTIKLDVYAGNTQGILQLQTLTIKKI